MRSRGHDPGSCEGQHGRGAQGSPWREGGPQCPDALSCSAPNGASSLAPAARLSWPISNGSSGSASCGPGCSKGVARLCARGLPSTSAQARRGRAGVKERWKRLTRWGPHPQALLLVLAVGLPAMRGPHTLLHGALGGGSRIGGWGSPARAHAVGAGWLPGPLAWALILPRRRLSWAIDLACSGVAGEWLGEGWGAADQSECLLYVYRRREEGL